MRMFFKILLPLFAIGLLSPPSAFAWTNYIDCDGGVAGAKVLAGAAGQFSGTFSLTTYSSTQAANGTGSCQMGISQGSDGWGQFGAAYSFPSTVTRGSAVWVRLSLYVPTGFLIQTNTGFLKFIRVHTASATTSNEGYHDLLISNPGHVVWSAGGNWTAPYIYNFEGAPKLYPVGSIPANSVAFGQWETYEMYVMFDSVSKDAGGRGEVRVWKNNALLLDDTSTPTLVTQASYSDGLYLFTYWNGNAPATQSLYVDDITITNETPTNRDSQGHPFIGGPQPNSLIPQTPGNIQAK